MSERRAGAKRPRGGGPTTELIGRGGGQIPVPASDIGASPDVRSPDLYLSASRSVPTAVDLDFRLILPYSGL
jgi:hypothetical protein